MYTENINVACKCMEPILLSTEKVDFMLTNCFLLTTINYINKGVGFA